MARDGVETAASRLNRERVAAESQEIDCHELFMVHDNDDLPIANSLVAYVSIVRLAPVRENAGRAWEAAALLTPEHVRSTFGGGTYQVRALNGKRNPIPGGTRHFQFAGPSYPMDGSGPPKAPEEPVAAPQAAPQPMYAPQPPQQDYRGLAEVMKPLADMLAAAQKRADDLMLRLVDIAGRGGAPAPAAAAAPNVTPEQLEAAAEAHLSRFLDGFKQAQEMLGNQYKMLESVKKEAREEGAANASGGDEEIALIREMIPVFGPMLAGKPAPNGSAK